MPLDNRAMAQARERVKIGFIGAGVVGTTLAVALSRLGYPVVAAASRTWASAEGLCARVPGCTPVATAQEVADVASLVFVTTPDDVIGQVVASVRWRERQAVVHCSGGKSLAELAPALGAGAQVGGFHPFQTFATVEQALSSLSGITYAIEAEGGLRERLKGLARALGGRPVELSSRYKALYHASAVMTCGYLVALAQGGSQLWEAVGLSRQEGLEALVPLMRATLRSVAAQGTTGAFTGPLARGDVGTVRCHLQALEEHLPHLLPLYCHLGLASLPIAQQKGRLTPQRYQELEALFHGYLTKVAAPRPARGTGGGA